jgi:nucleoside-diphosphate kinase
VWAKQEIIYSAPSTNIADSMEKTLVLVKPDGVRRGLIGEVIKRIESNDLSITAMKMMTVTKELANEHYAEHVEKPFFDDLITFISSGPIVAMAVEGENAVSVMRKLMGATNPKDADPGTIRGDYGLEITENIVHGSDSTDSATRELALYFPDL